MHLEEKYILKFQDLVKRKFNQNISHRDAFESLTRLVNLVRLIDKPITEAEFGRLQERRKELGILTQ